MSENDLNVNFYNSLSANGSDDIVNELKIHEQNIQQIVLLSARAVGQQLSEARSILLSLNSDDSFDLWIKTIGISRATAYRQINLYEASLGLDEDNQNLLDALPKSLAYAVSNVLIKDKEQRSEQTNKALESVFDGDIKSLPEFKEALAEKNQEIASKDAELNYSIENAENWKVEVISLRNDYDELNSALKDAQEALAEKEANPIIREVERYPDDYKRLKIEHDAAVAKLEKLSSKLNAETNLRKELVNQRDAARERSHNLELRLSTTSENDDNYEYLKNQLDEANFKLKAQENDLNKKDLELAKFESATNYISQANQSLDATLSPLLVQINPDELESDSPLYSALVDLQQRTNNWSQTMSSRLSEVK
ncbi:MAG: hypothetical protein LBT37_06175 [Lactobacillaceae bacterium]|jgi:hypothetical protein|nr:hypothetical protein [Lactobacillaceae bacterium]